MIQFWYPVFSANIYHVKNPLKIFFNQHLDLYKTNWLGFYKCFKSSFFGPLLKFNSSSNSIVAKLFCQNLQLLRGVSKDFLAHV